MGVRWSWVWMFVAWTGCGVEEEYAPPQLEVSATVLDLGTVTPGGTTTATLTLSNLGEVTLGLSTLGLGGGHEGFSVLWDPADMVLLHRDAPDLDSADTGQPVILPGGYFTLALPPQTSLDVEIEYSPVKPGESWNALVVGTSREARQGLDDVPVSERIYADRDNRWVMVYLRGESAEPQTEVEPRILVGGRIALAHTAVEPGGTVSARALVVGGHGEPELTWLATEGAPTPTDGGRATWTAPGTEQRRAEALRVTVDGALHLTEQVDVFRTGGLSRPIRDE